MPQRTPAAASEPSPAQPPAAATPQVQRSRAAPPSGEQQSILESVLHVADRAVRITMDAIIIVVFSPVIAAWWLIERRRRKDRA